jgi:MFS family permease
VGPEAVAALVGAGSGGGIAILTGLTSSVWRRRRDRRAAAQLIFAELVIGCAAASAAIITGEWSSRSGGPERSAWMSYGSALLPSRSIDKVANLAQAYRALEDIAWLIEKHGRLDDPRVRDDLLGEIETGIRSVAVIAGKKAGDVEQSIAAGREADERFRQAD